MADLSAAALCISISILSLAKLCLLTDIEISAIPFMVTFNWELSSFKIDVILFSSSVEQIDHSG